MQPLYTHVNTLVTSDFQICFPALYLNLHAKYSHMTNIPGAVLAPVSSIYMWNYIKNKHHFLSLEEGLSPVKFSTCITIRLVFE